MKAQIYQFHKERNKISNLFAKSGDHTKTGNENISIYLYPNILSINKSPSQV